MENLSDYELQRLRNIEENNKKLKALGIFSNALTAQQQQQTHKNKCNRNQQKRRNLRSDGNVDVDFDATAKILAAADKTLKRNPQRTGRGKNMREDSSDDNSDDDDEEKSKQRIPKRRQAKIPKISIKDQRKRQHEIELNHLHNIIYDETSTDAQVDQAIADFIKGPYTEEDVRKAGFKEGIIRLHKFFWSKKYKCMNLWYIHLAARCKPDEQSFIDRYEGDKGPFYMSYLRYWNHEQSKKNQDQSTCQNALPENLPETFTIPEKKSTSSTFQTVTPGQIIRSTINGILKQQCPVCKGFFAEKQDGTMRNHDCQANLQKHLANEQKLQLQNDHIHQGHMVNIAKNSLITANTQASLTTYNVQQETLPPLPMPPPMPPPMPSPMPPPMPSNSVFENGLNVENGLNGNGFDEDDLNEMLDKIEA